MNRPPLNPPPGADLVRAASAPGAGPSAGPSSLLGKTAWSTIANLSVAASSAITVVIVARLLGTSGTGEIAYGVWIAGTAAQVALLALPSVALRFLSTPRDSSGLARWIFRRSLVLAVPGTGIAVAVASASGRSPALAAATGVVTVGAMISAVAQAVLAGEQRFRRLAVLGAASAVLQVAAVAAGSVTAGPVGGLLGHLGGQAPFVLGLGIRGRGAAAPSPEVMGRVRTFALRSWVGTVAALAAWGRLEFVFLQAHGPGAVAVYAVALTVAQLGTQPTALLGSALLPHFGELVGGAHDEAAKETFAAVTRVLACIAFPLCFGVAAVAPALVPAAFGEAFADAIVPAVIVTASASLVGIGAGVTALVYAYERTRFTAGAALLSGAVTLPLLALVVPAFGTTGAAIVRSAVQGAGVLAGFGYAARRLGARLPIGSVARAALAAAIAAALGRTVVHLGGAAWASVLGGSCAVALGFALLASALRVLEAKDVTHLGPLLTPLPEPVQRAARAFLRSMARPVRPE